MKYLQKFFENKINNLVNDTLVGLSDDGFSISVNLPTIKQNLATIHIKNTLNDNYTIINRRFSDYEDDFGTLYNLLKEYDYEIFTIKVNSIPLRGEQFISKDFEYIWDKIINFDNIFLNISIDVTFKPQEYKI